MVYFGTYYILQNGGPMHIFSLGIALFGTWTHNWREKEKEPKKKQDGDDKAWKRRIKEEKMEDKKDNKKKKKEKKEEGKASFWCPGY